MTLDVTFAEDNTAFTAVIAEDNTAFTADFGAATVLERGTNDYEQLINKPSIEGVTLEGNKTFPELNLVEEDNATILDTFNTVFEN